LARTNPLAAITTTGEVMSAILYCSTCDQDRDAAMFWSDEKCSDCAANEFVKEWNRCEDLIKHQGKHIAELEAEIKEFKTNKVSSGQLRKIHYLTHDHCLEEVAICGSSMISDTIMATDIKDVTCFRCLAAYHKQGKR
jgi:hypothetical protein